MVILPPTYNGNPDSPLPETIIATQTSSSKPPHLEKEQITCRVQFCLQLNITKYNPFSFAISMPRKDKGNLLREIVHKEKNIRLL